MIALASKIQIAAPVDRVYAYATCPQNWCEWYPKTSKVERRETGPAAVGDRWTEHLTVAGLDLRIDWTTAAAEQPNRWAIRGVVDASPLIRPALGGTVVEIRYEFSEQSGGTLFRRSVSYELPNFLGRLVGGFLRRRIAREVQPASENLKRILER